MIISSKSKQKSKQKNSNNQKNFDSSRQFGQIESKYLNLNKSMIHENQDIYDEKTDLRNLNQVRPSILNFVPSRSNLKNSVVVESEHLTKPSLFNNKNNRLQSDQKNSHTNSIISNNSEEIHLKYTNQSKNKIKNKPKNLINQMSFDAESTINGMNKIKNDDDKLKNEYNPKQSKQIYKDNSNYLNNFTKLVSKNHELMSRITKLKNQTSNQSQQISSVITSIDQNEKFKKEMFLNSSMNLSKRSRSRLESTKTEFKLSQSKNILHNNLPKLPENILCQNVDLTKPNLAQASTQSFADTVSSSNLIIIKPSRYRLSTNNSSTKMSQSLYEKARNSKISDYDNCMNYIQSDLENIKDLPQKLKNVKNEFFDSHSKIISEIKTKDIKQFPYKLNKSDDIVNSPSLEQKDLKEYHRINSPYRSKSPNRKKYETFGRSPNESAVRLSLDEENKNQIINENAQNEINTQIKRKNIGIIDDAINQENQDNNEKKLENLSKNKMINKEDNYNEISESQNKEFNSKKLDHSNLSSSDDKKNQDNSIINVKQDNEFDKENLKITQSINNDNKDNYKNNYTIQNENTNEFMIDNNKENTQNKNQIKYENEYNHQKNNEILDNNPNNEINSSSTKFENKNEFENETHQIHNTQNTTDNLAQNLQSDSPSPTIKNEFDVSTTPIQSTVLDQFTSVKKPFVISDTPLISINKCEEVGVVEYVQADDTFGDESELNKNIKFNTNILDKE